MNTTDSSNELSNGLSLSQVLWMFLAALGGIGAAYYILPLLLPSLSASVAGADVKVFWYLSRGTAIVAFIFLWLSMLLGLLLTTKFGKSWPGLAVSNDFHQFVSLFGLFFVLLHILLLLGDAYMNTNLWQLFIPFGGISYRPLEVALGQIGFYGWIALVGSFYVRKLIGKGAWRAVHFSSFVMFIAALIHGVTSGTDTNTVLMQVLYWMSAGSVIFLVLIRVMTAILPEDNSAAADALKRELNKG
jgi:sulfoxide reductase heme-binding subunit YedZ